MARAAAATVRDIKVIGLVGFGHLMSHFYFLVLPPILPVLKDEFDVGYAALGLLMTGFGLAAGIMQTPIGFLVDRVGGRPVLVIGLLIEGAAIAAMGLAADYWQLLVLYTVAGAANTVFHPADYAILSAAIAKDRLGRAYSIHLFSGNLGWAVTPAVMIGLSATLGWRWAFVIVGAIGVAFALVLWGRSGLLDVDIAGRAARARAKERTATDGGGELARGLRLLFSLPVLMCLLFYMMLTLGFTGIRSFFVAATDVLYGTSLTTSNAALTAFLLGSAGGILAGGVLADRLGPRIGTAAVTLSLAGALIVVVGAVPLGAAGLIAVLGASGTLQGLLLPTRDLLIRAVTPEGSMGKVMGFVSSGMMLSGALVPIVFGWVLDFADARWVFWISAVFVTGALFTFVTARERASD